MHDAIRVGCLRDRARVARIDAAPRCCARSSSPFLELVSVLPWKRWGDSLPLTVSDGRVRDTSSKGSTHANQWRGAVVQRGTTAAALGGIECREVGLDAPVFHVKHVPRSTANQPHGSTATALLSFSD